MGIVKWVKHRGFADDDETDAAVREMFGQVPIIPLADLTELVEMLRTNIAHSFINADEISAYRLACEQILTQLTEKQS